MDRKRAAAGFVARPTRMPPPCPPIPPGTLRDLYAALSRAAGLGLPAPERRMAAARLVTGYGYHLDVHTDPKTR